MDRSRTLRVMNFPSRKMSILNVDFNQWQLRGDNEFHYRCCYLDGIKKAAEFKK